MAPASVWLDPDEPEPSLDRYRLVSQLGQGGLGTVWEAVQVSSGRHVAVKMLQPPWYADPDVRQRFIREGQLASATQHRHIVEVLDVGADQQGRPYIAMELLGGPSLAELLERSGPLPWPRVARMLRQICEALDHAHRLKIIHRDVKPSNVVLANDPEDDDHCKLVDFGIAKQHLLHRADSRLTRDGQVLGSPGFMSPEQIQQYPTDHRSDVFGLACTAYYLLTGEVPYGGQTVQELLSNPLHLPPHPLEVDLPEALRVQLEAVLHRALRREPQERFDSILDFVVALNQLQSLDLPSVSAKPPLGVKPDLLTTVGSSPQPGRPLAETLEGRNILDHVLWEGDDGFVELARLPPDIIVVHMSGCVDASAGWLFDPQLRLLLDRNLPSHVFWRLDSLESCHPEVREACLRCLRSHGGGIESVHVLDGSKLVGMAISLAAMTVASHSERYDDPARWYEVLDSLEGPR